MWNNRLISAIQEIRLDCSPSQYSPPHCCSTSDCLTPGKEYNCLSPEVKYNAGPKITDYYTPISNFYTRIELSVTCKFS